MSETNQLLPELIPIVLSYYTDEFSGLVYFSTVCKEWKRIADSSVLWKECEFHFRLRQIKSKEFRTINIHCISLFNLLREPRFRIDADYVVVAHLEEEEQDQSNNSNLHQPNHHDIEISYETYQVREKFLTFYKEYRRIHQKYYYLFQIFRYCSWCKKNSCHLILGLVGVTSLISFLIISSVLPQDLKNSFWFSSAMFLMMEIACILSIYFVLVEEFNYRWRIYRYYDDFMKHLFDIIFLCCFFFYMIFGALITVGVFIANVIDHLSHS